MDDAERYLKLGREDLVSDSRTARAPEPLEPEPADISAWEAAHPDEVDELGHQAQLDSAGYADETPLTAEERREIAEARTIATEDSYVGWEEEAVAGYGPS